MKKRILFIMSLSMVNYYLNADSAKYTNYSASKAIIGGWAPVFFNNYDSEKINQINQQILDKKIKAIKINYSSNMTRLAIRIKNNLYYKQVNFEMNLLDLKDMDGAKYKHNQVVVTLYF